jgi:hypothetical protein
VREHLRQEFGYQRRWGNECERKNSSTRYTAAAQSRSFGFAVRIAPTTKNKGTNCMTKTYATKRTGRQLASAAMHAMGLMTPRFRQSTPVLDTHGLEVGWSRGATRRTAAYNMELAKMRQLRPENREILVDFAG